MKYAEEPEAAAAPKKGNAPGHTHGKAHDQFLHKSMPNHSSMEPETCNSED